MEKQKNIAIIPARGGSKRIPRKNIKPFLGKPIIAYSIEAALKSNLFDEVMVSTDDDEIAQISKKYGAKVPFLRDKKTADDHAGIAEVLIEVINEYRLAGKSFKNVCCLLATAPFVTPNLIIDTYSKIAESNFSSVFPVVKYAFPIQRAMRFNGDKIGLIWPENLTVRSQDLEPSFHDAGLFYWASIEMLLKEKTLWSDNTTAIEISEQVAQDIDTPEDWQTAEIKYKILYAE